MLSGIFKILQSLMRHLNGGTFLEIPLLQWTTVVDDGKSTVLRCKFDGSCFRCLAHEKHVRTRRVRDGLKSHFVQSYRYVVFRDSSGWNKLTAIQIVDLLAENVGAKCKSCCFVTIFRVAPALKI